MTAARPLYDDLEAVCVLAVEPGALVVLADEGPLRTTYGGPALARLARGRERLPEAGEWVLVRRWTDGPVTFEARLHD